MQIVRFATLAVLWAAAAAPAFAQTVPARGTDGTFDVATWNREFFGVPGQYGPPNDAVQLQNVVAVMQQSGIDLWALQEVVDTSADGEWNALRQELGSGFGAFLGPEVSSTPTFDQRLAFVYDRSVVQPIRSRAILESDRFDFGGRAPIEMQARVTIDGVARTIYVITFHAKAGTGAGDYADRVAGAEALKGYIDDRVARGEEVVLLGDFNDLLVGSTRGSSFDSPYDVFVEDAGYVAATLPLQQSGANTYCRSATCNTGDTRDHLLFTAGLSGLFVEADRYDELLTAVPSYVSSTSDHLPALARFTFTSTAADDGPEAGRVALLDPAPSPFRGRTRLRFRLGTATDVRLEVFDALGRRVASLAGRFGEGDHAVPLDGGALQPGLYVVRLAAGGEVHARPVVRAE
jgi:endonuclease/exonuclease/phosphatase family metal-dependent hydrolase